MKMRNLLVIFAACLLSILSSSAQSIPSYIPTNGLVGWWPFNGNAQDESGSGNNGTVNGATLTSDRFGNSNRAFSFNGSSRIKTPITSASLDVIQNLTLSFWVKQSNLLGDHQDFIWRGDSQAALDPYGFYRDGNEFAFRRDVGSGSQIEKVGFPKSLAATDTWIQLVGVFDANSGNMSIYLNGQMMASRIVTTPIQYARTGFITQFGGVEEYPAFIGFLDDIAIWNRTLSSQEINNLYLASSTGGGGTAGGSKAFPRGISYQAIARNAQAQPLLNTALQLRFTIVSDSVNGSSEYVETQALSSNAQGLINTSIGNGTAQSGSWAAINWAAGRKFLRAEINAGSGFVNLGTQEMLSVPFSQRSKSADAIENSGLLVFGSNAEALSAGLKAGQMYRTATGVLMVVY